MKLTDREKWLMKQALNTGGYYNSLDEWLNEVINDSGTVVEQALAHDAPTVNCKQCANRGQINGTSQELVCDSCTHYGSIWRKDMFVPKNNGE